MTLSNSLLTRKGIGFFPLQLAHYQSVIVKLTRFFFSPPWVLLFPIKLQLILPFL